MKKIRFVFVALAIGLWVPMLLLVEGALQSVSLEREVRHQTLAERVFDEMQRQLGEVSERETSRSFAEYGFYLGDAGEASRSPLSRPPSESYVIGYFQIDPDGAFSSPRVPKNPTRAIERGDWPATDHPERALEELKRIARAGIRPKQQWVAESTGERVEAAESESVPDLEIADSLPAAPQDAMVATEGAKIDSYQSAVRSLNRAADRKLQRKRTEYAFAPEIAAESGAYSVREPGRSRSAAALPERANPSRSVDLDDAMAQRSEPPAEKPRERPVAVKSAKRDVRPSSLIDRGAAIRRGQRAVEVDSIVGNWVRDDADRDYIVLHRTATLDGRLYRQGLVIDVGRLAGWLRNDVLRGKPLEDRAQLELVSAAAESNSRRYRIDYSYRHRFADPFDDVLATLSLPVLADAGGSDYLYVISGLLMIVGTVGLFALYRMVYVTVSFADRRNNFVAAVSHELKTPLTAIRMYGEMLRDDMVPTEAKRHEYYATITAESERLTRLINNVLEFSRIEQGTREMSLVAGAIGPVIAEAAALLEPHAREQGFAIEVDVASDLPAVRFDRDALLQVVFNLVDNALKYARGANDRVIRLDARQVGDSVVLWVRDRGPGVPADHLPKIFEPFYRGQKELTRTAKGTGIGLALVKGLCERMGAAVTGRNGSDGGFEVALTFSLA